MRTMRWTKMLCLLLLPGLGGMSSMGCEPPDAPGYLYGVNLATVEFELTDLEMGVHPNQSVLEAENNPFQHAFPGKEVRWDINDGASDAAAFYSWATLLALEPTGENQFYTALKLKALYESSGTKSEYLPYVRQMAVDGFQAILDHFPGSATYDVTGVIPYMLAPLAYQNIVELGGSVQGGWVLVESSTGKVDVVKVESDVVPLEED